MTEPQPGSGPNEPRPGSSQNDPWPDARRNEPRHDDPRHDEPLPGPVQRLRPTSGNGDPRVRHTGPGPGAGGEQQPGRSSKLSGRLALAMTVVIGQLWGLTIAGNAWMQGRTDTAGWLAGFLGLSFVVVLVLWLIDAEDR
ncbi:hypothetical protein [Streptomyces sp. 8N706]|uniref:hypothetical protein n=1 Tax=Streptomyces sp. 8N706 TaxID=3457416 RepID=UPI003FCF03B7